MHSKLVFNDERKEFVVAHEILTVHERPGISVKAWKIRNSRMVSMKLDSYFNFQTFSGFSYVFSSFFRTVLTSWPLLEESLLTCRLGFLPNL